MFDFDNFKEEVLEDYNRKRKNGQLNTKLEHPSPANLRDYALQRYHEGLKGEDLIIFQEYFNANTSQENLERNIKNIDLGKLKSVQNLLVGNTKQPDELIIKLIAVLINFEKRPYSNWKNLKETNTTEKKTGIKSNKVELLLTHTKTQNIWIKNVYIFIIVILLVVATSIYFSVNFFRPAECMYWNGENYTLIKCTDTTNNHNKIPLENNLYQNFKKITRTDTLTETHEGRVWYSKIKNKVEFFTLPGFHPIHKDRMLKPATVYIIEKYRDTTLVNIPSEIK